MIRNFATSWALLAMFLAPHVMADNSESTQQAEATESERARGITPDLRDDETKLKLQKGDLVVVPIPISNPTLDSGLVVGGAYFYSQTEQQKKTQPASVTAVAGMYTSNDSLAYGVAQQNYWKDDKWRFGAVFGHADLNLTLRAPTSSGTTEDVDWLIDGNFLHAQFYGNFAGRWYAGPVFRFVDVNQFIGAEDVPDTSETSPETIAIGAGINIEYDRRDMPLNTYEGNLFQLKTLFNDESLGSDTTYQSYDLSYRSYHEMKHPVVLAWEVEACERHGDVPLWDMCRIGLRGFPATAYLGKKSVSSQFEARWRMSKKWGAVGFAGAGYLVNTYIEESDREVIPSYGVGLRYMVLPAKRINIRLDFAWSTDSDAIYFSVGEAF